MADKGTRTAPVIINGDQTKVVGWLILSDEIGDEEVIDSTVSWCFTIENPTNKLMAMSLVPKLRVQIENDRNILDEQR